MATFVVRRLKDGTKRIKVMVRRSGTPGLTQTFGSRREAELWALQVEGKIASSNRLLLMP